MFQLAAFALNAYLFSAKYSGRTRVGFPIRTSTDLSLFAAPRSFSQLITSFIACLCQGIHHEPYLCLTLAILHMPHHVAVQKSKEPYARVITR